MLTASDETLVAPDGRTTPTPSGYRWWFGDSERDGLELEMTPDTRLIDGLGSGWIGGASYRGRFRGSAISGTAYYEHAERRNS